MQRTTARIDRLQTGWTETDQSLMNRALELAALGKGLVSPGPLVGCVIAQEGAVVGEGFYIFEEVKHAETIALEEAGELSQGATAYVSLEPHAHHGRTSPCTDALIAAGIKRVVAPIEDPNPKVFGAGFAHLKAVGLEVAVGLMAEEATRLNEAYVHFMRTGRPFVHLKLAVSLDGKVATRTGDSRWITSEESRRRVHELRHESDAILVGIGTALADDPLLTDRSGKKRRRPLLRVVLDEKLKLGSDSQLARTALESPVLVVGGAPSSPLLLETGVEVFNDSRGGRDLMAVLEELGRRGIQSVLIEGGARVAGKFFDAQLIDKVTIFIAPLLIGGSEAPSAIAGVGATSIAEALRLSDVEMVDRHGDIEITGYPPKTTHLNGAVQ
ncbi:MAG TPA: bifunctional diaminohydroxyphosphoribosylaminopyrimidine deaminase/5-amino-6-(5-phosphoribosylamino)uracil reductase RibD [Pyrinomonadaceae bacterium]|nr:bifunctional diaminohydroxyphosphoribosylaminopyrimidine deaminase/5-amino-6-(5-phosphoribosylamino)uracil reductase RibD [Pyrinomonadaceae bacterium]